MGEKVDHMDATQPVSQGLAPAILAMSSRAGLSFDALADAAHIDHKTLRRRMADGGSFRLSEVSRIAAALGTTVSALLERAART